MSMYIVRATDKSGETVGYLWWGKLVASPASATHYSSPSAARAAIKRAEHLAASWCVQAALRRRAHHPPV